MKIVHISPAYYDESSVIGGGERYVLELALQMAKHTDTTMVSFSSRRMSYRKGCLQIEIYPFNCFFIKGYFGEPVNFGYIKDILYSDVVHVHQLNALVSNIGAFMASIFKKRIFATHHAHRGNFSIPHSILMFKKYNNIIAQSEYCLNQMPHKFKQKAVLIRGGVDINRFCPSMSARKENKILCVGRIMPHKGTNYLLEAFRRLMRHDYKLIILGRVYNNKFYQYLKQLALGANVEFVTNADDDRLLHEYRTSKITVLPSVNMDYNGTRIDLAELMGLVLLESQACGTPVICTDTGGMKEFVDPGQTGYVVKQNDPSAIAEAINQIIEWSSFEYAKHELRCREWVRQFGWQTVVKKHLEIYNG